MKKLLLLSALVTCIGMLSACATTGTGTSTAAPPGVPAVQWAVSQIQGAEQVACNAITVPDTSPGATPGSTKQVQADPLACTCFPVAAQWIQNLAPQINIPASGTGGATVESLSIAINQVSDGIPDYLYQACGGWYAKKHGQWLKANALLGAIIK